MNERNWSSFVNGIAVLLIAAGLFTGGYMVYSEFFAAPQEDESLADVADRPTSDDNDDSWNPFSSRDEDTSREEDRPAFGDAERDFDIGHGIEREPLPVVGEFESPFVAVADRLKPSVVNIVVEGRRMTDPYHQGIEMRGGGTGVIVDKRGYVLTNNHVVTGAEEIVVTLSGGEEREGTVLGADPESDLAVIDIGTVQDVRVAQLGDSDAISIGDWAIAMGNPLGLDWTLTVGIISAKGRSDLRIAGGGPVFQDFIQTDASINFGNSGGPLANIHGEVIGINAATNASANGIGFAIPINMARKVVGQLLETGYVRRGYLGLVPTYLDGLKKEALGLDETVEGVFIESVGKGTPAEDGGIEGGDVVVAIDGDPVNDVTDFRMRIANHEPGDKLKLTVIRQGDVKQLTFTLADRSDFVTTASEGRRMGNGHWLGLDVTSLSSPEARQLGVNADAGVMVVAVEPGSASDGKLEPGDVIVRIGEDDVETLDDWRHLTSTLGEPERAILIKYIPAGQGSSRFLALKP
ncbi:trypsin-like peptidase domain-containing protein [bacterium]|nr:trypsin-like peptidase domain-containing protein [bacterium]